MTERKITIDITTDVGVPFEQVERAAEMQAANRERAGARFVRVNDFTVEGVARRQYVFELV